MNKNNPLISVIVPVYNVEPYLERCVESIRNQSYKNLEIILVDDGSPDNCGKMCDEFAEKDSRIRTVHRKNGGQSAARNSGLSIAKGDYIGFVDSDDYIEEDMYEVLFGALKSTSAQMAVCDYRVVNESGAYSGKKSFSGRVSVYEGDSAYDIIIPTLNNSVWNKLYKKECIKGLTFPEGQIHGEDFIFVLESLKNVERIAVADEGKYYYLQRSDSITGKVFSEKKLDEIKSKDRILEIIGESFPSYTDIAKKWCFKARMNVIRAILKNGFEKRYCEAVTECKAYVKSNFANVKKSLSGKEYIEYILYIFFKPVYKILIKKL